MLSTNTKKYEDLLAENQVRATNPWYSERYSALFRALFPEFEAPAALIWAFVLLFSDCAATSQAAERLTQPGAPPLEPPEPPERSEPPEPPEPLAL